MRQRRGGVASSWAHSGVKTRACDAIPVTLRLEHPGPRRVLKISLPVVQELRHGDVAAEARRLVNQSLQLTASRLVHAQMHPRHIEAEKRSLDLGVHRGEAPDAIPLVFLVARSRARRSARHGSRLAVAPGSASRGP